MVGLHHEKIFFAKNFALNPSKLGSSVAAINEEEEEKNFGQNFLLAFFAAFRKGLANFVFCRPPIYFSKSGIDRQLKEWLGDFFCQSCPTEYIED